MKRGICIFLSIVFSIVLRAQVRWDGEAGDGRWGSALNWSGDAVPLAGDDVLLDNSIVPVDYVVSLDPGNFSVSIGSLVITPGLSRQITLLIPVSNASPVAFAATGTGDAVILNRGALFRNSSGAASGTPVSVGPANFFRINNGGRYVHNTERGHTTDLVTRLSSEPGTEEGIFEFDVPSSGSYTISASGRTYGHLIFSATAAGGAKTYAASGISPVTINGDLEINTGAVLSYGANTSTILLNRNCILYAGAVFNISNGANNSTLFLKGNLDNQGSITETGSSTGSGIVLNGDAPQQISSTGTISQSVALSVGNAAGIFLSSPLNLPFHLSLTTGTVHTTAANILALADNATCTGGSAGSFVEGPMTKKGDDDFIFPVGIAGIYAPIGISGGAGAGTTDEFTAEYIRSNPQSVHGAATDPFFNHISFVEYWKLNRTEGLASKVVTLTAHQYSFVKDFTSIYAAVFNGSQWLNLGRTTAVPGPVFPPFQTGNFDSGVCSSFGDFTLATPEDISFNPLPVQLLLFSAEKINNSAIRLRWKLARENYPHIRFDIQKANADGNFITLDSLAGGETPSYCYVDRNLTTGNKFYRLRMTDADRITNFSAVVTVSIDIQRSLELLSFSPVSGHGLSLGIFSSVPCQLLLSVYDLMGREVCREQLPVMAGTGEYRLKVSDLPRGIYLAVGLTGKSRTNVVRLFRT